MSNYKNPQPGGKLPAFNETWWPNDGVVNTVSMSGPKLGSRDRIEHVVSDRAVATFTPGIWHAMGLLAGWDHLDVVGQQTRKDFRQFYLDLAALLADLPAEGN